MNLFERLLMRRLMAEAGEGEGAGGAGSAAGGEQQQHAAAAGAEEGKDTESGAGEGSKSGAEKTDEQSGTEKKGEEGKQEEKKPDGAPEKYEFKAGEGQTLDADALAVFEPLAKELGLTQENAQKVVDAYASKILPQIQQQQLANWQKTVEGWAETVKADKEIGGDKLTGNLSKAQQAMMQFGGEDLKQALEETGLGNHPALVKAFVKIGHAMSEDKMLGGGSNGEQLSAAQVLYGKK